MNELRISDDSLKLSDSDIKSEITIKEESVGNGNDDEKKHDQQKQKTGISTESSSTQGSHCGVFVEIECDLNVVKMESGEEDSDDDHHESYLNDKDSDVYVMDKILANIQEGYTARRKDVKFSLPFSSSALGLGNTGNTERLEAMCIPGNMLKKRFVCTVCNYQTNKKSYLNKHLLIHLDTKRLKCDYCDYKCNRSGHLKIHMLTHSSTKSFKCTECDYKCNRKGNLKSHMLTHSSTKLFICPECDYSFKRKAHLKDHMLTHSAMKLFKCPDCDFRCKVKGYLKSHMLTHLPTKLFKCSQCDYECNHKSHLRRHVLNTHSSS